VAGGLPLLRRLLSSHHTSLQLKTIWCISNLMANGAFNVTHAHSHSHTHVPAVMYVEENQVAFVDMGGLEDVIPLLNVARGPDVVKRTAWAMANLTESSGV